MKALRRALAAVGAFGVLLGSAVAIAQANGPPQAEPRTVDRVAVRYYAPETGGASRPRFILERILAFEARLEALGEENALIGSSPYQERHIRAAVERHVAEELLSALMVERGSEPPDLPRLTTQARNAIVDRVGGEAAFVGAMTAESIEQGEVTVLLRRRMRAAFYVDRSITPLLHPTEEELHEIYRTAAHPFRSSRFEDVKPEIERWFILERLRVAEGAFLQAARTRIKIIMVSGK